MPGRRKARASEAAEKTEPRTGRHDGPCFDELAIFLQSFLKGKFTSDQIKDPQRQNFELAQVRFLYDRLVQNSS